MRRPRRHNRTLVVALYVNAALLFGILLLLLSRSNSMSFLPAAYGALSPQPIAGGANLYLMPAQFTDRTFGCYILDIDTQTLCAYRYFTSNDGTALRLVAARKITYDRRLTNVNSDHPSWLEVKDMVEQQQRELRGTNTTQPAND